MRFATIFIAASLLTSCVAWTPRSIRTSPDAVVLDNMPLQKWGIEACGAGALSTVLQHHGDPRTMSEWDATLPRTRGGVMTIDLLLAARARGFDTRLVTGDESLLRRELEEGRPVILMLQVVDAPGAEYDFFHYIVVDGIDRQRNLIRTQFGDGKPRWVRTSRLQKSWKGGGNAAIVIKPAADRRDVLRTAILLEESGKHDDAAKLYRELLDRDPNSSLLWTNLGNVENRRGRREDAENAYRKAISVDQGARDALNNLAWMLYENARYDEAESLARRARALGGPDAYLILDTLAHVLAARGSCVEAKKVFAEAAAGFPASRVEERAALLRAAETKTAACKAAAGSPQTSSTMR